MLAMELGVRGLMNVQFAVQGETLFILEVNPRASRTVPFVSKATVVPLAKIATKVMLGMSLAELGCTREQVLPHWTVKDGILHYDGKANSLQTVKDYGNVELYVDWKIEASGDSGIYLRGNPQVQIWDVNGKNNPKKIGSGGLYNNQKNPSNPIANADNPPGQWNTFHIVMKGDKVTIKLNGKLVVDNTTLENYWERGQPLPSTGPIELQHHGDKLWFKNIYVKELN